MTRTIHEGGAAWNRKCVGHGDSGPFRDSSVASRSDEVIASEGEADDRGNRRRSSSCVEDFRPSPYADMGFTANGCRRRDSPWIDAFVAPRAEGPRTKPSDVGARRMRQLHELSGLAEPGEGLVFSDFVTLRDVDPD